MKGIYLFAGSLMGGIRKRREGGLFSRPRRSTANRDVVDRALRRNPTRQTAFIWRPGPPGRPHRAGVPGNNTTTTSPWRFRKRQGIANSAGTLPGAWWSICHGCWWFFCSGSASFLVWCCFRALGRFSFASASGGRQPPGRCSWVLSSFPMGQVPPVTASTALLTPDPANSTQGCSAFRHSSISPA